MPSTTPDFSTVTAGCSVFGAAAPLASLKVVGDRGARRCGGTSPGLCRSGFGQASSNDAGGGSAGSGGGGTSDGLGRRSADKRSGGNGSAGARLRPLALFARGRGEQQVALRFGRSLGRRGVSRRSARRALILPRGRHRRRRRCGRLRAACALGGLRIGRETGIASRRALAREAGRKHRPHRDFAARLGTPPPSRCAIIFNSRTASQNPNISTPVQTPVTPL